MSWTALTDATGYTVTATANGQTDVTATTSTNNVELTGLADNVEYTLTVVVTNGSVESKPGTAKGKALGYIAATAGKAIGNVRVLDDTKIEQSTAAHHGKVLTFTVDGVGIDLTIDKAVTDKAGFIAALNAVLAGKATASFDTDDKLTVVSATKGTNSSVVVAGDSNTKLAFFGNGSIIQGAEEKN